MKTKILLCTAAATSTGALAAQTPEGSAAGINLAVPQFFFALVAGILLAMAFQYLLSSLAVSLGISLLPNPEKQVLDKHGHKKSSDEEREHPSNDNRNEKDRNLHGHQEHKVLQGYPLKKAVAAVGLWSALSAVLSTFAAVWLAVSIGFVLTPFTGMILGLTIWAGFFLAMAIFDARAFSALAGGLFNLAGNSLKSTAGTIGSAFSDSPQKQAAKLSDHTVEKVRDEVFKAVDKRDIDQKLDEYVDRLEVKEPDYNEIRRQLATLLDEIEIKSETAPNEAGELEEDTFVKVLENHPGMSKRRKQKLKGVWGELKAAQKEGDTPADQLASAHDRLSPGSQEDGHKFRNRIEEYLKKTDRDELDPESIKDDINQIVSHPKQAPEIIRQRAESFDRDTAVQLLAAREDVDQEQARQIVNRVESTLQNASRGASEQQRSASAQASTARETCEGKARLKGREAEDHVRCRIDGIPGEEFDYDTIKRDLVHIFHHPGDAPEVLKQRLSQYDRESLINLLASRKDISRPQAERIVERIEDARDEAIHRAEQVERIAKEKYAQGRQALLHEAEDLRRAAGAAATWTFISGIASGTAAVAAGLLAVTLTSV